MTVPVMELVIGAGMTLKMMTDRDNHHHWVSLKAYCGLKENKYRGGTSDATTSSSLIVPLFRMSVDDFSHSKRAIFGARK